MRGETAFDTLTLDTGASTAELWRRAADAGMNLRRFPEWGDTMLGIALDETTTRDDIVAPLARLRRGRPAAAGASRASNAASRR